MARRVDADPVAEAEQALGAGPFPDERIDGAGSAYASIRRGIPASRWREAGRRSASTGHDRRAVRLAIDSKLRGCDVVKIKIGELVSDGRIRTRAIVVQQKTGRPVQFELWTMRAPACLPGLSGDAARLPNYAFPSRIDRAAHLSTRQYARFVDEWVTGIGLPRAEYGTHSLRRTKASIIYKATGNLRAVQILLGHTKIENTVRFLGVDVVDALTLAEGTEI